MSFLRAAVFILLASVSLGAETDAQAAKWLAKAQRAAGGAERLAAIQDIEIRRTVVSSGPLQGLNSSQTIEYVLPDTLRQTNQLDFGFLRVYVSGDKGWIDGIQGFREMPALQLQQAQGEIFRVREKLLLADRDAARIVRFVGESEQDGRAAAELEIASADGAESVRIWIDAASGEFFRAAYDGIAVQGAAPQVVETYSDFRDIEGVRVPFRTTIHQNDRLLTTSTVSAVKFNQGLTPEKLGER